MGRERRERHASPGHAALLKFPGMSDAISGVCAAVGMTGDVWDAQVERLVGCFVEHVALERGKMKKKLRDRREKEIRQKRKEQARLIEERTLAYQQEEDVVIVETDDDEDWEELENNRRRLSEDRNDPWKRRAVEHDGKPSQRPISRPQRSTRSHRNSSFTPSHGLQEKRVMPERKAKLDTEIRVARERQEERMAYLRSGILPAESSRLVKRLEKQSMGLLRNEPSKHNTRTSIDDIFDVDDESDSDDSSEEYAPKPKVLRPVSYVVDRPLVSDRTSKTPFIYDDDVEIDDIEKQRESAKVDNTTRECFDMIPIVGTEDANGKTNTAPRYKVHHMREDLIIIPLLTPICNLERGKQVHRSYTHIEQTRAASVIQNQAEKNSKRGKKRRVRTKNVTNAAVNDHALVQTGNGNYAAKRQYQNVHSYPQHKKAVPIAPNLAPVTAYPNSQNITNQVLVNGMPSNNMHVMSNAVRKMAQPRQTNHLTMGAEHLSQFPMTSDQLQRALQALMPMPLGSGQPAQTSQLAMGNAQQPRATQLTMRTQQPRATRLMTGGTQLPHLNSEIAQNRHASVLPMARALVQRPTSFSVPSAAAQGYGVQGNAAPSQNVVSAQASQNIALQRQVAALQHQVQQQAALLANMQAGGAAHVAGGVGQQIAVHPTLPSRDVHPVPIPTVPANESRVVSTAHRRHVVPVLQHQNGGILQSQNVARHINGTNVAAANGIARNVQTPHQHQ